MPRRCLAHELRHQRTQSKGRGRKPPTFFAASPITPHSRQHRSSSCVLTLYPQAQCLNQSSATSSCHLVCRYVQPADPRNALEYPKHQATHPFLSSGSTVARCGRVEPMAKPKLCHAAMYLNLLLYKDTCRICWNCPKCKPANYPANSKNGVNSSSPRGNFTILRFVMYFESERYRECVVC
jgi:hypothetical protein